MDDYDTSVCLLMLAGDAPAGLALADLRELLKQRPYIIAADGGAQHLADMGIVPHLLVGDCDSLDSAVLAQMRGAGAEFAALPREKDFTDGEAAFRAALDCGYKNLAVFGALGGDLDHQLGNLLLPLAFYGEWQSLKFFAENCRAFYCFDNREISGDIGDTISLIPLSAAVRGLTLKGFRYALTRADTALGQSLCLRNELAQSKAQVEMTEGILLIIHYGQK